jgi:hypothetical protein
MAPTAATIMDRFAAIDACFAVIFRTFTSSTLSDPEPDAASVVIAVLVAVEVSVEVSELVIVTVGVVEGSVGGLGSTQPVFRPLQGMAFILMISTQHWFIPPSKAKQSLLPPHCPHVLAQHTGSLPSSDTMP